MYQDLAINGTGTRLIGVICRGRESLFLGCPSLDDRNNHYDLLGGLAPNWNVAKPTVQIFPEVADKKGGFIVANKRQIRYSRGVILIAACILAGRKVT
jgi:hypothetical protein